VTILPSAIANGYSGPLHSTANVTAWQLCSGECGFVAHDGVEDDQELPCNGDDGKLLGA
jgi:hypothetical protein